MPDLSYTTLMRVLKFLYEDKCDIPDVDAAVELWRVCEKYQFLRLKDCVEKYLELSLTVKKAISIVNSLMEVHLQGTLKVMQLYIAL